MAQRETKETNFSNISGHFWPGTKVKKGEREKKRVQENLGGNQEKGQVNTGAPNSILTGLKIGREPYVSNVPFSKGWGGG